MRSVFALAAFAAAALSLAASHAAEAQVSRGVVKVVVLNDQNSVYSGPGGKGSVVAAQLAIDDFGPKAAGAPIELVAADHQLKVDVAVALARKLIDQDGADAFFDIGNSAISLALQDITKQTNTVVVHSGSGTVDLIGKACSTNSAMWLYDTYQLATGLAKAMVDPQHKNWFVLAADYAFGQTMTRDLNKALDRDGGKIVGVVRHPVGTADFSSFLLQASGTNMEVLALLNAGSDTINALKQANEFGLMKEGTKAALPIFSDVDAKAIGPEMGRGGTTLIGYYWDKDDESRAFAKRFQARFNQPPTHVQVAVYSAVLHYLKAVDAAGTDAGDKVVAKMKELPVNDVMTKNARVRADGRLERDMMLAEIKPRSDMKSDWDVFKLGPTIKAADMLIPLSESECPLVKKSN